MKTKKKKLSHQSESWFHLGKGHFPLSFSSSTYFAKTSLHRPRRESSANSDTLPSKNKENFLMCLSRWHKCETKTMNKPQESVIFGSSGNLRHQCPIHHSQLSESGTHCVNWWCHFFCRKTELNIHAFFATITGPIKIWWSTNEKMFKETLPVLSTRCSSSGVPLTKENCNSVSKQDLANSSRKGNPFASVPLQVIQQKSTN